MLGGALVTQSCRSDLHVYARLENKCKCWKIMIISQNTIPPPKSTTKPKRTPYSCSEVACQKDDVHLAACRFHPHNNTIYTHTILMLRKCGFFTEKKITAVLHHWLLSRSLHGDLAWWCTQGCDVTVKQRNVGYSLIWSHWPLVRHYSAHNPNCSG